MVSRPNLRLARRAAPVALLAGVLLLAAACTAPALPGTPTAERGVGVSGERGPDSPATQEPAGIASPAAGPQPSTATGPRVLRSNRPQRRHAPGCARDGLSRSHRRPAAVGRSRPRLLPGLPGRIQGRESEPLADPAGDRRMAQRGRPARPYHGNGHAGDNAGGGGAAGGG